MLVIANRAILTLAPFIASGKKIFPGLLDWETFKEITYTSLNRYDAGWYAQIAESGYLDGKSSAFFPLFPALIKGISAITGLSFKACGQGISVICFIIALWLVQLLTARDGVLINDPAKKTAGRWIACLIAFNPVSFYYTICYTESLFLMLTLLFMLFAADEKWLRAGITGFFAGVARNSGVFLAVVFLFEYFRHVFPAYEGEAHSRGFRYSFRRLAALIKGFKLKWLLEYRSFFSILLIPAGTAGYFIYLLFRFGSLTSALNAVDAFGRSSMAPWLTLYRGFQYNFFKLLFTRDSYIFYYFLLELLAVLMFIFAAIFLVGRVPLSYNLFMIASLVLPLCKPSYLVWTDYFLSFPRYTATLFPYFAAQYLTFRKSRKAFVFYIAAQIFMLVRCVALWGAGKFIA